MAQHNHEHRPHSESEEPTVAGKRQFLMMVLSAYRDLGTPIEIQARFDLTEHLVEAMCEAGMHETVQKIVDHVAEEYQRRLMDFLFARILEENNQFSDMFNEAQKGDGAH